MNWVDAFYFNDLASPWALLLLLGVLLVLAAEGTARAPGVLTVSTGETLRAIRGRGSVLRRWGPAVLRAVGLSLLVLALARPQAGYELRRDRAEVVDIMLAVDVSGSMRETDYQIGNQYLDRLTVTKKAVRDFVQSRKERRSDRFGIDRLGLVLYAGIAWTQTPLTLDYDVLEFDLERAEIDESDVEKQGTAIGSAIGLAVQRLRRSEAQSKVIVLLTDGLNNRGEIDPLTAAHLAERYDIRIYTIGAGAAQGGTTRYGSGIAALMRVRGTPIDEASLREIAEITGGRYYRAENTESLQEAYAEIDQLETTEIEVDDYYDYDEAFMPYAVLGGVLVLGAVLARRRWCETVP